MWEGSSASRVICKYFNKGMKNKTDLLILYIKVVVDYISGPLGSLISIK